MTAEARAVATRDLSPRTDLARPAPAFATHLHAPALHAPAAPPPPSVAPRRPLDLTSIPTARRPEPDLVALPHHTTLQRLFGPDHDLSRVRARIGGDAAREAHSLGATAFARGDNLGFRAPPSLELAAHEAAHVIQQRRGGAPAGREPQWERHADLVAARVAAGLSAAALLARLPAHPPVVQTQRREHGHGGSAAQRIQQQARMERDYARVDALLTAQKTLTDFYAAHVQGRPTLQPGQADVAYEDREAFDRGFMTRKNLTLVDILQDPSRGPQNHLAYADKRDSSIHVRENDAEHSQNQRIAVLMHELLHTLVQWQPAGGFRRELDEAATQFLTLCAYRQLQFADTATIQRAGAYVRETTTLATALAGIGVTSLGPLADAYFAGKDSTLAERANAALAPGHTIGWQIFLTGFRGGKFVWDFDDPSPLVDRALDGVPASEILLGLLDRRYQLTRNAKGRFELGPKTADKPAEPRKPRGFLSRLLGD